MIVENKIFTNNNKEVNGLADETITLLRKLVMMLAPISTTAVYPIEIRVEATGSVLLDGIGTTTAIGGTIPTITTINQLGGAGLTIPLSPITNINTTPINGGWNYSVGDTITLSGGTNGSVIVTALQDKNISTIDLVPISGGTGYVAGEIITIVNINGNGINGKVIAYSVDNSGAVVEVSILSQGYDYYVGYGYQSTTTGSGSGLIVNITSIIENIGPVGSVSLYNPGSNYTVGNVIQVGNTINLNQTVANITSTNGTGIVISILGVDNSGRGNMNFIQSDLNRWLYTDMIRNGISF